MQKKLREEKKSQTRETGAGEKRKNVVFFALKEKKGYYRERNRRLSPHLFTALSI
jgi:hypothetical protein